MSRLILIIVLGGFITYSITSLTQNKNVTQTTENSVDNYSQTKTRNIANSTVQMLMSQVADDYSWRVTTPVTKQIFDGEATYTVTDETIDGEDLIKFSVTSKVYGHTKNIEVYAKPMDPYPIGVNAPSPVSTNNNILTLGNITIDGRNHSADGTLIPGEGTNGIWTTKTYTQGGASNIGGTYEGTDYAPSPTPDPSIIAEDQTWPGGTTPTTPEQVITNLPNGFSLKEYAQSGDWGSQYVTDPKNLTYPLGGVTYVELPTGGTWDAANIEGSGILIVHNDNVNAVLKNTSNDFVGLIIADDIIHLHSDIIGAVVSLTENPSAGNTVGNSSGSILYSIQVLDNTLMSVRPRNHGFASNRLDVKHWFE
jgi:hypothetical protein